MAKKTISTKEPGKRKSTPALPAPAKASAGTSSRTASKPAAAKPAARSTDKTVAKQQSKAPAKAAAPSTVTLKHLSAGIVERHGLPKKQADTVLAEVFAQLVDHLRAGERVRIGGLGIIQVKGPRRERAAIRRPERRSRLRRAGRSRSGRPRNSKSRSELDAER